MDVDADAEEEEDDVDEDEDNDKSLSCIEGSLEEEEVVVFLGRRYDRIIELSTCTTLIFL
jgi:hypothetical protein